MELSQEQIRVLDNIDELVEAAAEAVYALAAGPSADRLVRAIEVMDLASERGRCCWCGVRRKRRGAYCDQCREGGEL